MGVNKVVFNSETLIELSADTVTAADILSGKTAQTKTVTPSAEAQTVLPDAGTDYLSQVTVNAIPYLETDNASGGKTVTIGV